MTGWWHPIGAGGWGWGEGGSPRQGGAGGLKIATGGFRLANVEAGSWRRGRRQAVFARSSGLCFPRVPGVSHGGAEEARWHSPPPPPAPPGEGLGLDLGSRALEGRPLPSRPSESSGDSGHGDGVVVGKKPFSDQRPGFESQLNRLRNLVQGCQGL